MDRLSAYDLEAAGKDPDVLREVENVAARKLGLADPLELGHVKLNVRGLAAWQGISTIGELDGAPVTEELTMFNALVDFELGSELVPDLTASYAPLTWVTVDRYQHMVATRDIGALEAGLDEVLFCVYGLCIETSNAMLQLAGEPSC